MAILLLLVEVTVMVLVVIMMIMIVAVFCLYSSLRSRRSVSRTTLEVFIHIFCK